MTLSKASLGAALADTTLNDPSFDDYTIELNSNDAAMISAAARFTERLLPGECPQYDPLTPLGDCPDCQNTGQLWDEGLVEVVAQAIFESMRTGNPTWEVTGEEAKGFWRTYARAVLAALAAEVGKE